MMSVGNPAVRRQGRAGLPESGILSTFFLLAGLMMQFNGYIGGVRYSDIICTVLIFVCLLFAARRGALLASVLAASASVSVLLAVSVIDFHGMAGNDRVWIIRCQIAVIFGALFYFSTEHQQESFAIGIVIGGAVGFLVALLELAGIGATLTDIGFRSSTAASRGLGALDNLGLTVRTTGMWGDANEFGPVGSLVVVASLFLLFRRASATAMLWISIFCVVLNTLFLSFNRSSMIATFISVLLYFIRGNSKVISGIMIYAAAAGLLFVLIFWLAFPEAMNAVQARYGIDAAVGNRDQRMASLTASFRIILEYPSGLSSEIWPDLLRSLSWVANPHNGFVATAYGAGLAFGCFTFSAVVYCIFTRDPFCRILAPHIFVIFFFETLNFSPGIIYLLGILWMRPVLDLLSVNSRRHAAQSLRTESYQLHLTRISPK